MRRPRPAAAEAGAGAAQQRLTSLAREPTLPPVQGAPPPGPGPPGHRPLSPLASLRQLVACVLLVLLSARLPEHLAALITALAHPVGDAAHVAIVALSMVGLDAFGVLCAVYLSHARLRGVPMLRCYPPQRLIPLSLHFLGLLWGLVTLTL